MNIEDLVARNKGPLIAIGGAAGGLVVLIVASAIVNMPEDINVGQIMVNVIWLIFGGLLLVAGFLYLRERFDGKYLETEEDIEEVIVEGVYSPSDYSSTPETNRPERTYTLEKKKLETLFGTTDMEQITGSVKAMYTELNELRNVISGPDLSVKIAEQEGVITALTSERDQAQALVLEWEAKAISNTQEVDRLREEIKSREKWEVVNGEQLAIFFPTVHLGDKEEPFLKSDRRQRRLMQRLNAEGYSITRKIN